jgi:hypothetical protein
MSGWVAPTPHQVPDTILQKCFNFVYADFLIMYIPPHKRNEYEVSNSGIAMLIRLKPETSQKLCICPFTKPRTRKVVAICSSSTTVAHRRLEDWIL